VIFSLIKSYLENRYQKVKFNNKVSKWRKNWQRCPTRINIGTSIIFNINKWSTFLSTVVWSI
jgi:hypothetical protein